MSFKVRLLLGAAVPIVFALPAAAQVQITTATTTPVATATAGAGSTPADVEITSSGSITLDEQPGSTAVTINSSNSVTNSGTISITDSNNATGVRISPGITGGYTGTGSITILEDYTRTDTDNDGDLDGPLAQGTGRAGILVDAGGALNGGITLDKGSALTVEGNDSFGVSVRSVLNGDFRQKQTIDAIEADDDAAGASVTVTGSNSIALDFREDITGNVGIGGLTQATGENSIGARFLGDVAGEFMIDGSIIATGFVSTLSTDYEDPDTASDTDNFTPANHDPDDILIGGPALEIRGDLMRGFLINGFATGGTDPTDDVKDVVQDFNENRTTGGVSSVGSAPALLIQPLDGAAGGELRLGRVRESVRDTLDDDDDDDRNEIIGVFDYDFGFINRGAIVGNGLNKGFAANAARIAGSTDGQHQTIIDGGIFNSGTITALSFEANALGLSIGAGVSTPQLVNAGAINAIANTQTNHNATAVRIDAGADLPVVINSGAIAATVDSYDANVIAFQDLSGTVTSFTNNSRIGALFVDDNTNDNITSGTGRAIALDLSHSGSGVTLTQTDTIDNTRIFGDILFGVGSDRFDLLSGDVFGDVDFGTSGSDVLQINSARLFGDAIFRGANANVSLAGAEMNGAITLNNAAAALSFTNKSTYNGAITSTGGPVSMVVNDSTVNSSGAGTLNLTSLQLANNAKFGFVINSARIAGNTPIFNITGAADIAANTVFTPIFEDFSNQAFTLRVLNAATLNLGGPASSLLNVNSPYLYDVELVQPNANALDLVLSVKTSQELGLNTRQADAYNAILALMEEQPTVGAAVTSLGTANEFFRSWTDLLPGRNATVVELLAANATAAFGATAHRLDLISNKPDAPGGAWVEEFGVYQESDASADGLAVSGGGFGVAAGVDLISTGSALIGAYAALESVEVDERNRTAAPLNVAQTTFGLYGGWRAGNFALNAAGGYGIVDFSSARKVQVGQVADDIEGEWDGTSYNFGARASYTLPLGFLNVKPFVAADYMKLDEDGYAETAGAFDDIALIADSSESTLSTASYGLSFTGNFGSDDAFSFKPELSVGYRNILSWDAPTTSYRFAGNPTGTPFTLHPGHIPEDGIVAGLGLNVESQFLNIKLGYDTEISDTATTHYGSITLRMAFW